MGSYLSSLGRFLFAFNLACTMTTLYVFNKLVELTLGWCTSKNFREQICLVCCGLAWNFTITTSPWIRISETNESRENLRQFHAALKNSKDGDPAIMCICNHTSFFDTLHACSYVPLDIMRRMHAYYSTHLDKIPILGFVCKAVGHFPVKFKSDEYGKFSVDREAMKVTQLQVDKFLSTAGNVLSYYPEGAMNKTPDTLQPFRYGGMKQALKFNNKIYGLIMYNNDKVWPRKAGVGGFPASVRIHCAAFAPQGSRQLVEDLRKKADPNYDGTPPEEDDSYKLLAEHLHAETQKIYNSLKADVEGTSKTD